MTQQSVTDDEQDWPDFALGYSFDSRHDPTEVTVFDTDADDLTTNWLSIDREHAIPLEETR